MHDIVLCMRDSSRRNFLLVGGGTILSVISGRAHQVRPHNHHFWITPHTVRRKLAPAAVTVAGITVDVKVKDQLALTKLVIEMSNPDSAVAEGQCLIPVPHGAVLKKYTLDGVEGIMDAELLPREKAKKIYQSIVSRLKDPALLEFANDGVIKSSVFPVPARGSVKLELVYETLLENEGGRVDYILPRTQTVDYKVPWTLNLEWVSNQKISGTYSPSHEVIVKNVSDHKIKLSPKEHLQPGSFRFSLMTSGSDKASASFYACPEEAGKSGHFMIFLTPPPRDKSLPKVRREVTLVIDKSGSMAGVKMDQVKSSVLQVIEALDDGETFNIIVYNKAVESFSNEPVLKSRETTLAVRQYIAAIRVSGGTNINGALDIALQQNTQENFLPLVVFFTDGVPTIGKTNEKEIRENAIKGNQHN